MLQEYSCPNCHAPIPAPSEGEDRVECAYCGRSFRVDRPRAPTRQESADRRTDRKVTIVVPDGSFIEAAREAVRAAGARPGGVSGRNFEGWTPRSPEDVLLIAVWPARGPPFAAELWGDYLPQPWRALQRHIERTGAGQLEATSPQGNPVVVVYGRTRAELQGALQGLRLPDAPSRQRWDPAAYARRVTPRRGGVSLVIPDASFLSPCRTRIAELGFDPRTVWGPNFDGWEPGSDDEILLIAVCSERGAPFAEELHADYLPRPWPELRALAAERGRDRIEGRTSAGQRVVVVMGQAANDLRMAIDELEL